MSRKYKALHPFPPKKLFNVKKHVFIIKSNILTAKDRHTGHDYFLVPVGSAGENIFFTRYNVKLSSVLAAILNSRSARETLLS